MTDSFTTNHLSHLRYILLPGTLPKFKYNSKVKRTLYTNAYSYWKAFWVKVFIDNGDRREVTADSFMRQDIVALLLYDDKIIGMHLYTFFDVQLNSVKDLGYFSKSFNTEGFNFFRKSKIKNAMSWEFLTVDPAWRKSKTGISFAKILVSLASRIQGALKIDAGIAVSRNDLKVTEMGEEVGCKTIIPHFEMYKTPCAFIVCLKDQIQEPVDPHIRQYRDALWEKRIDLTGTNLFTKSTVQKAA